MRWEAPETTEHEKRDSDVLRLHGAFGDESRARRSDNGAGISHRFGNDGIDCSKTRLREGYGERTAGRACD